MGYYVNLIDTNAYIPKDKLEEAYKILCELNNHNELKRGGRGPRDKRLDAEGPHDGIWFSWMDWNYPETCADAAAILAQVGFELSDEESGDLRIMFYDNKTGCEQVFAAALAPVLASHDDQPPYLIWVGENHEQWRQIVIDGQMVTQDGEIVFS